MNPRDIKVGQQVRLDDNWQELFEHTSMGSNNCKRWAGQIGVINHIDRVGEHEIRITIEMDNSYVLRLYKASLISIPDTMEDIKSQSEVF